MFESNVGILKANEFTSEGNSQFADDVLDVHNRKFHELFETVTYPPRTVKLPDCYLFS